MPNERDSEYASSTEVTEIEFHRRASDYPREEEMNCTLRYTTRGCASRARICVYVRFILWSCQSSAADETDGRNDQVLARGTQTSNSHATTPPVIPARMSFSLYFFQSLAIVLYFKYSASYNHV